MKAEFFPPREDIILVNEAPSEFYIVVNGSAVSWTPSHHEMSFIQKKVKLLHAFPDYSLVNICTNICSEKESWAFNPGD